MRKPSGEGGRQNRVRFSTLAEGDLESIAAYTSERFSETQAQRYRDALVRAIELLAAFPNMGTEQEHIAPDLRRHVHASHAIYYSKQDDVLSVERILGSGQDPLLAFEAQR